LSNLYCFFLRPSSGVENCIYSSGYFVKPLLLPATSSSAHHQELKTVYIAGGTSSNLYCCHLFLRPSSGAQNCIYSIGYFVKLLLLPATCSSAHHQELKTVYTAAGTSSNLYCYLSLLPPPIVRSSKLYIQHRVLCQTFTATCHLFLRPSSGVENCIYSIAFFVKPLLLPATCSSAHHQELKTVYTASGTLSNLYCYLPLLPPPSSGAQNCIYSIGYFVKPLLLPATSSSAHRQELKTVYTVLSS